MNWVGRLLTSSVGCKVLMAVTGAIMLFFLLGHVAGNLLVFAGADVINAYARGLRDYLPLLWLLRAGLLISFVLHVIAAIRLTRLSRRARPVAYQKQDLSGVSLNSRTMVLSGLVLLAFIIYHLAHLTFRLTHPAFASLDDYDVYSMLQISFQQPLLAFTYIISVALLMMHLSHGITSLFQTLGLNHTQYNGLIRCLGPALGLLLGLGFSSVPLAIMLRLLP